MSLFVYKMQILKPIEDNVVREIEGLMSEFLWRGKREKIQLKTLQISKEFGGFGLVNIRKKHESLLLNWVADCRNNSQIRNLAYNTLGESALDDTIWKFNLKRKDSELVFKGDTFWHHVVHLWHEYCYSEPQNDVNTLKQLVSNNSMIVKSKKTFCHQTWGKTTIKDLFVDGKFLTWETFHKENQVNTNWLEYKSLIEAIPSLWKFMLKTPNLIDEHTPPHESLGNLKKLSNIVYKEKTKDKELIRKCVFTWKSKASVESDMERFKTEFKRVYSLTSVVRLRDFQLRLLHNKIFCNDILRHWGIKSSNACEFCGYKQTIMHLMWECQEVQKIWTRFAEIFLENELDSLNFANILFNRVIFKPENHIVNFLVLVTKQFIFRKKCQNKKLSINELMYEYNLHRKIELYNAATNQTTKKCTKRWSPVSQILLMYEKTHARI